MSKDQLQKWAQMFDHTQLRPQATQDDIKRLCEEAAEKSLFAVCISPIWVSEAVKRLEGSNVQTITVVGFPSGATTTESKCFEAKQAIDNGAKEIDMVMNIGAALDGNWHIIHKDISSVVKASQSNPVKVILETCYLSQEDIRSACRCAVEAGAKFVKTSTGFGPSGAQVEDIKLMRECVGPDFGVKASGGVKSMETFLAMLEAGANRIGSSSSFVIMEDLSHV